MSNTVEEHIISLLVRIMTVLLFRLLEHAPTGGTSGRSLQSLLYRSFYTSFARVDYSSFLLFRFLELFDS
jgi:hypothetical protein